MLSRREARSCSQYSITRNILKIYKRIHVPRHEKANNVVCHEKTQISLGISSVWSVFAIHMKKACIHSYLLKAEERLWSVWSRFWFSNCCNFLILHLILIGFVAHSPCADPESFVRGGPIQLWWGYFFMRGEDPNTYKSGPSSARHQNAILMGFPWRPDDGPTLNAGLAVCDFSADPYQYCQETIYFVIFRGEGGGLDPLSPPPHVDPRIFTYFQCCCPL